MRAKSHSAPLLQEMLHKDPILAYGKAKHLEHSEPEGIHEDHQSPSSGHVQNHTRNHTMFQSVVQILLELRALRQTWSHDYFPGEPVPGPNNPLGEKPSPNF